jgi:hypothetical protein
LSRPWVCPPYLYGWSQFMWLCNTSLGVFIMPIMCTRCMHKFFPV